MDNTLLSFVGIDGSKKLLFMYFSVEVSEQFLNCMNRQLTKEFQDQTGLIVKLPIWMGWKQESGFVYSEGSISKINAQILLKYGTVDVWILWQSKSGRIYGLADTDIDCHDVQFWFEELDAEACKLFWKPKWTLLRAESFKDLLMDQFKEHGIEASYKFLKCADDQLSTLFYKATGLKSDKNLCLYVPSKMKFQFVDEKWIEVPNVILEVGNISKLKMGLWVGTENSDVTILWKSKSSRIYQMNDNDIDCADIEFSFEKLDVQLYFEQFYPKGQKLPFVLKDLPFELVVTRLNIDCNLLLTIKEGYESKREDLIKAVESFTDKFNTASEKKSDTGEIVQKCLGREEGETLIIFDIDMSLAGFEYFKKLLKFLSKTEGITKVEIA